jgi:hypothetical protein
MRKIYIANANFEWECEQEKLPDLYQSLHIHPLFLQLQFLPLLFSEKETLIAVTQKPPLLDPESFIQLKEPHHEECTVHSFAPSQSVQAWAREHGYHYDIPSWDIVKRLSSKETSFHLGKSPEGSALLFDATSLHQWALNLSGPKVLKSCFGFSGRGHRFLTGRVTEEDLAYCEKEWRAGRPLVAEPWVERLLDLSSHWHIGDCIHFKGVVRATNSPRGSYQKSEVGPEQSLFSSYLPFVQEHLQFVKPLLQQFKEQGFFGPISFDAMIYGSEPLLQPLVEINPRLTMGSVALGLAVSDHITALEYRAEGNGLLPERLGETFFKRNLCLTRKSISL